MSVPPSVLDALIGLTNHEGGGGGAGAGGVRTVVSNERDLVHLRKEAGGVATEANMPLSGLVHAVDRRRLKIRKNKDEARVLHIDLGGAQPS